MVSDFFGSDGLVLTFLHLSSLYIEQLLFRCLGQQAVF